MVFLRITILETATILDSGGVEKIYSDSVRYVSFSSLPWHFPYPKAAASPFTDLEVGGVASFLSHFQI